ncbi:MAG: hypothetical protein OXU45_05745, partial [Candidatus Melainabacteria bacterium]|nr:hypothetical protein [Candidatus Melainabacteria bacterium]
MMGILFRVLVVLVLFCSVSGRVSAAVKTKIRPVTSPQNINLNPNKTCTDFTVTLDDNIDALTGSGTINAKLKINKKFLTTETSNFSIPYVDGAIGTSDSISVCLVDPDSITKTRKLPLTINIERKLAKKHKIKKLKTELAIYAGTVTISGKAIMPSSPLSQKNLRLKLQTTGDDSLTSSSTESDEELELELEEDIVIGATVELFEVDDEGQTIGEAIATTTTDVQGEFELEIPSDGGFDTDHVVNVSDGEEEVHSFVTEEEIIADPVSELIYENIQETATNDSVGSVDEVNRDVEIDDFNAEEVNSMREHIDELGVSFEEEGVSETVTSLESTIGGFVDNMIEVIMDEETDSEEENATEENQTEAAVNASGVAGDYFVAFFDAGISGYVSSDSDDGTASTQSAIELGTARLMKPSEAGVLHVVEVPKLNSQARLVRDNFSTTDGEDESNSGFLRLALSETEESDSSPSEDDERYDFSGDRLYILEANTDRENEGGNSSQEYFTSINSNNVINFVEPGREYSKVLPGGISGFREDPQVENFFPVGDGLFLSSSFGRGEMFSIVSG